MNAVTWVSAKTKTRSKNSSNGVDRRLLLSRDGSCAMRCLHPHIVSL